MKPRPAIFVGSSTEGLTYAKALQVNLDHTCQVTLWSQGVFGLGGGTLEDLVAKINEVDFAVLVVTPDDMVESRDVRKQAPRDNVLLELGICIGALGRERSFLLYDRTKDIKLPSDLAGITPATFQPHHDNNTIAEIGAACTMIELKVKELGKRAVIGQVGIIDQETQFRIVADLLGYPADNLIIQMHELGVTIAREQGLFARVGKYWYGIQAAGHHAGTGRFSMDELCNKMSDAGILYQDLKYNVGLTERGHEFAKWLTMNNYRAESFISPFGSWGVLDRFILGSVKYFTQEIESPDSDPDA